MNITPFALVLAAAIGCAQPAFAQTQDQTGAMPTDQASQDAHATTGAGSAGRGNWRDDEQDSAASERDGSGNSRGQWNDRGRMVMRMGPMWRHRQMMMGAMGAHFRFTRGNARIDVRCSVQEDTEACVRAAGQLIDKIAELHESADRDNTTGSAGDGGDRRGGAASEDEQSDAPGERM
jgi:hypothetical protein